MLKEKHPVLVMMNEMPWRKIMPLVNHFFDEKHKRNLERLRVDFHEGLKQAFQDETPFKWANVTFWFKWISKERERYEFGVGMCSMYVIGVFENHRLDFTRIKFGNPDRRFVVHYKAK